MKGKERKILEQKEKEKLLAKEQHNPAISRAEAISDESNPRLAPATHIFLRDNSHAPTWQKEMKL